MKSYLTEFIGTFFLVLTICLTVTAQVPMAPLAIGASLMIMVYMGGHISGGHYNPAVSLAVLIRGKMKPIDFLPYLVVQILGAIVAALIAWYATGDTIPVAPGAGVSLGVAIVIELLYTFALALVVLNTATDPGTEGNSFYGLAIGFTVVVAAFAGGAISGGAFNPAVGLGPNIVHAIHSGQFPTHFWIYLLGPLAGGALAAAVYLIQHPRRANPAAEKMAT